MRAIVLNDEPRMVEKILCLSTFSF